MTSSQSELDAYIRGQEKRLAERTPQLPFEPAEYARRMTELRSRMARQGIDILILSSPDGMCWLHGYDARWYRSHSSTRFPPTQCTIVHLDHDRAYLIETPEHEQLAHLTSHATTFRGVPGTGIGGEITLEDFVSFLAEELAAHGRPNATVGVERWSSVPNPAVQTAVEATLTSHGYRMVDGTAAVRAARRLKSAAEIAVIERAQAACDTGIRELRRRVRVGMTELEAWSVYMSAVIAAGGEPSAMHETIAAGAPMPMLHGSSSRRPFRHGDHFHTDVAAAVHRYHARATRPFHFGEPPRELAALARIVAGAHDVLTATARPGLPFRTLNRALREYYADAGVTADGWAGGYELGVSFPPDWVGEFCWSSTDRETDEVIENGLVTNFESCAFVAMVDTVVFDDDGARLLSSLPRELLIVGDDGRGGTR
ncbi:M24 family metallopeptidase [Embleya scabrispora]|uniref:M24 family metallopeptidase n=1 Tax=Embleya scabrispora TaxID=159449 RepID=UPI0007C52299|nr:Xaa-Pro peptidase family protein [Embleya scabrispora]MYS86917.1 M24 family metallopeptidase [Streptomyces sp. SID5474]